MTSQHPLSQLLLLQLNSLLNRPKGFFGPQQPVSQAGSHPQAGSMTSQPQTGSATSQHPASQLLLWQLNSFFNRPKGFFDPQHPLSQAGSHPQAGSMTSQPQTGSAISQHGAGASQPHAGSTTSQPQTGSAQPLSQPLLHK